MALTINSDLSTTMMHIEDKNPSMRLNNALAKISNMIKTGSKKRKEAILYKMKRIAKHIGADSDRIPENMSNKEDLINIQCEINKIYESFPNKKYTEIISAIDKTNFTIGDKIFPATHLKENFIEDNHKINKYNFFSGNMNFNLPPEKIPHKFETADNSNSMSGQNINSYYKEPKPISDQDLCNMITFINNVAGQTGVTALYEPN